jgi:diketogulonate reductase-like aldo/keto reductase
VLGNFLVDTAESYCTEEIVGEAVQPLRNQVFIATKVSPGHFRRSDVLMSADKSLKRLRTDYIDVYQLHWPHSDARRTPSLQSLGHDQ